MSAKVKDFNYSDKPEPHKERTKIILKEFPEIRKLITKNPYSFLILLFVLVLQITMAVIVSGQVWWSALLFAYIIGAFANHTMFVLIHECAHNLIFKKPYMNKIAGILADLPIVVPSSISFRSYHLKHHTYQGDYFLDADLASKWEAKLIGNSFLGKTLWLLLFPFFQAFRPMRLKGIQFFDGWTLINWIVVFSFDVAVIYFLGWNSFLYFLLSFFFSIGLHPLGARWIQEHYLTFPPQETYSYYGPINIVALNVGYHNEHHDFQSVPWNKLTKIRSIASKYYDNLIYHKSWVKLFFKFLFDPKLSLFSRMVRRQSAAVN